MVKQNKYTLFFLIFIFFNSHLNSQKIDIIVTGETNTGTTILNNLTTSSGKELLVSENPFMFKEIKIERN